VFDYIVLDYFRSPCGWALTNWATSLFDSTLPSLLSGGYLAPRGQILLPNQRGCAERVCETTRAWFKVSAVEAALNPLYIASDNVHQELRELEDGHTNRSEEQRGNLIRGAEFLQLQAHETACGC
jgi:hypothetical protein